MCGPCAVSQCFPVLRCNDALCFSRYVQRGADCVSQMLNGLYSKSYTTKTDIKMGDHPVIWVNPEKPSRNVYFQFGHSKSLFDNPAFVTLLENSLRWTLKDTE